MIVKGAKGTGVDAGNTGSFWDERFGAREYVYGVEPNQFLVQQRHRLERGMKVLLPGDGEGRNGVWMAQQGMDVTTVDASPLGLQKALKLALGRGVTLKTQCADLLHWDWPVGTFDVVALVFLHFPSHQRPAIHEAALNALAPGGLLLLEAFHPDQLNHGTGGPKNADMLYNAEQLRGDFAAAEILELDEVVSELDEGPFHSGPAATTRLVARRV